MAPVAPDPTMSMRRHVNAWRDALWASDLTSTDKLVGLAYADHAGDGPLRVWVTVDRLQARTSLGRTATTAAVRRLRATGWLTLISKGRVGATTRYALSLPGADVAETEHDDQVADVDLEHQEHEPRARRVVSPRDEWVSRGDERVSAGDTDPLPIPCPIPHHQPLAIVEDNTAQRDVLLDGVAEEIRTHPLARGLAAAAARTHAVALRAAGWTPDSLGRELRAMDATGARNPAGLLRFRLAALAQTAPTPPPEPRAAVRPTTTTRALFAEHDKHAAAAPPSPETLAAARAAAWRRPTTR